MAAILEAAANVKIAKIDIISADRNGMTSRPEAIVENHDTRQMRDIFLQYAKRVGMRFEPENIGVEEVAVKVK